MTTARTAPHATTATLARWALLLAISFSGLAMAQAEATLDQVYQAAQAGRVEQALQMMQPVLRAHPGSGKAHFVRAELLARQGQATEARTELATAERLAPGLPFADKTAVQHLQRELGVSQATLQTTRHTAGPVDRAAASAAPHGFGMPWAVVLALAGGALAAWLLMRLGRPAAQAQSAAAAAPGWSTSAVSPGASAIGAVSAMSPMSPMSPMGPMVPMGPMNPSSSMNTMAAGGTAQPAPAGGLGSRVAGGLATGLAAGAGLMAAEEIGRNLFGGGPAHAAQRPDAAAAQGYDPVFGDASANPDMGGNDFGISDAGAWDDAAPDSSDWDL